MRSLLMALAGFIRGEPCPRPFGAAFARGWTFEGGSSWAFRPATYKAPSRAAYLAALLALSRTWER